MYAARRERRYGALEAVERVRGTVHYNLK
jgi:hypothetical protein